MKIGPILGIMSTPKAQSGNFTNGQNESFTEIIQIAQRMGCTAFVFNPLEIDFEKNAVWGYHFNSKILPGEWERHLFPLPSVIYNRIPNRTMENREDIKKMISVLKKKFGSSLFNPGFLDKWKTHSILYSNKLTKGFLPATVKLTHPELLVKTVENFGSVYLKPSAKSLGNDIFKVCINDVNQYSFIHQSLNQLPRTGVVSDCALILEQLPAGNSEYLIQQDISLAKYKGHPFDLRLLVQKDKNGKWLKTGMAARIAGEGSITTHVFYGGSRSPAEAVIKYAATRYGFPVNKVHRQLDQIKKRIPRAIEKGYGESFGELEMDIGIDSTGKVWFLEANSKPFRFDEKIIRAKSLIRLIHYVRYLDSTNTPSYQSP